MLSCRALLVGPWLGEEINISTISTTLDPKTSVVVSFCSVLFIRVDAFRTRDTVSPAAMDGCGAVCSRNRNTLGLVFSPGLVACHSCPHTYLLKLSVLPDLGFLNPISGVICWRIWPMFTTYCELHAVDTTKMPQNHSPFLKETSE